MSNPTFAVDVYKCKDIDGNLIFDDHPCGRDAQIIDIRGGAGAVPNQETSQDNQSGLDPYYDSDGKYRVEMASTADLRAVVDGYFVTPTSWILKPGNVGIVPWRYTTTTPPTNWVSPSFETTTWETGNPGFWGGDALTGDKQRTPWPNGVTDLWLRATFKINYNDIPNALLWGRIDDTMEVYINGVLALTEGGWSEGYRYYGITDSARAALKSESVNIIAVHAHDAGGGRYFDLGMTKNSTFKTMPMSGSERTPALAIYGKTVRKYMLEHGIPAGVLAVMKKDQVGSNAALAGLTNTSLSLSRRMQCCV